MCPLNEWGNERKQGFWESGIEALSLLLLMWPATVGMGLMGSTRVWGYAPGLFFSLVGAALVWLRPVLFRRQPSWQAPPGFRIFAGLCVYIVMRVPFAAVPYAARWDALRWVCLLMAAWAWAQVSAKPHRWKWLLSVLFLALAFNGLYALFQHINGSRAVLWAIRPEQYEMRVSGTYLCPNHLANMLAMAMPLAFVLIGLPEAGFPLRLMALYFLGVAMPVLYWTQSRSGWLGAVAGLLTSLVLLAWRHSRRWLLLALLILPLVTAAAGGLAWKTLPAIRARFAIVIDDPVKAGGSRLESWRDVPAMVQDRPVWGFGGGSFVWVYPPYQVHVRHHLLWDYLHNEYLQALVEYGAVGLAWMGCGLLVLVWMGTRAVLFARSRESAVLMAGALGALAGCLVHACFDFNFHIFPNPHALVWIGGLAWGVWLARERGIQTARSWHLRARQAVAWLAAAICLGGAWLALAGGMSYWRNLQADIARQHLEWDLARKDYERAIAWDSGNWRPYLGLGNLEVIQARWWRDPDLSAEQEKRKELAAAATQHFQDVLKRNPCEMAAELGLAQAANVMGDRATALEHLRRAATFQRRHVFYREQLGIQLRRMGRTEEALEVFRKNVADAIATDISRLNIRQLERELAKKAAAEP